MPVFNSSYGTSSYPGPLPPAPAPPAVAPTVLPPAPPVAVPALGLGLSPMILIISGDVSITTLMPNVSIQRR